MGGRQPPGPFGIRMDGFVTETDAAAAENAMGRPISK